MSHIHIPDGVLPWWLWLTGWLVTAVLLGLASRRATRSGSRRAVPIIGAVSALVLVSMSSEIVPIAYHVNLTVIAGVLLGPWLGMIAAFIVVLVLRCSPWRYHRGGAEHTGERHRDRLGWRSSAAARACSVSHV